MSTCFNCVWNRSRENMEAVASFSVIPFESPTSIMIAGPSNSGKTSLCMKIFENAAVMFKQKPSQIIYCYGSEWQPLFTKMKEKISNIQFQTGLPDVDIFSSCSHHCILICDDLMSEISQNHWAEKLFCAGIHHTNITVIYLVQNIFPKGKVARTISLNTHYLILFDNRRDKLQIQTLGRQIFPGRVAYFMSAFEKAISNKSFGYLLLDLSPQSGYKEYQLRSNILPFEDTRVYVPAE